MAEIVEETSKPGHLYERHVNPITTPMEEGGANPGAPTRSLNNPLSNP